jgi:hypothetical protein
MSQIYTIDETQIGNIKKRFFIRIGKIFALIFVFIFLPQIFIGNQTQLKYYGISFIFTTAMMFFLFNITFKRQIKSYKTLQIVLSEDGVEQKADMMPYKKINWNNLLIQEKRNGVIILNDTTYSTISRRWNGFGRIFIQPEIMNREQLLLDLQAHLNKRVLV